MSNEEAAKILDEIIASKCYETWGDDETSKRKKALEMGRDLLKEVTKNVG